MNRLTDKNYKHSEEVELEIGLIGVMYSKLNELEDLLDKYNIKSVEELEEHLDNMRDGDGKTIIAKGILYNELSKELGCPLEVVFEAYKKGIVDKYGNEWIVECNCQSEMMCSLKNDFDDSWYETDGFEFKDYQKTWWVKGEKDE